jgi:hypothetical protein
LRDYYLSCIQYAKSVYLIIVCLAVASGMVGCASGSAPRQLGDPPTQSPTLLTANTWTTTPSPTLTPTATPTSIPSPTSTPTPTNTPTPTATPIGNADGVFLSTCNDRRCLNGRIFRLDLETGDVSPFGEVGDRLQDISTEGRILYSNSGGLYMMDGNGANSQKIADNFPHDYYGTKAYWRSADEIIYISTEGKGAIYRVKLDGSAPEKIVDQMQVLELFPVSDNEGIFWVEGEISIRGIENYEEWWSSVNGDEHVKLEFRLASYSRFGHLIVYPHDLPRPGVPAKIVVATTNGSHQLETVGSFVSLQNQTIFSQYIMSPDQEKVLVEELVCSPICDVGLHYLIVPDGSMITELPDEINIIANGDWSPDSQMFFYQQYTQSGRNIALFNFNSMKLTTFESDFLGNDFLIEILWIPHFVR